MVVYLCDVLVVNKKKHDAVEHIEHKAGVQATDHHFSEALFFVNTSNAIEKATIFEFACFRARLLGHQFRETHVDWIGYNCSD